MTGIGQVLALLWLLAGLTSYVCIRDPLSPDKLVLAALGIFFADIYVTDYSVPVVIAYVVLLVVFASVVATLGPLVNGSRPRRRLTGRRIQAPHAVLAVGSGFFWLASIPALAAQVAMVQSFGGIEGYIAALALRVIEFQGLGWLSAIIQTYAVIDLVYFAFTLSRSGRTKLAVVLYAVHLAIFVVLALLSGSRGSLLVNFVLMLVIYHVLVARVRLPLLMAVATCALLVASVLEVAREGVKLGDEGLVTGLSESRGAEKSLGFAWATYGTTPLELVFEARHVTPHYGFTYLTWITNLVPRAVWPDKPDSGGVVLTKEYTGDAWGGASHLSTGVLPEAIINFGPYFGFVFGVGQFILMLVFLLLSYRRYMARFALRGPYDFIHGVQFAYISWATMGLIIGEFTNVMITLTVQLFTVWLLSVMLRGKRLVHVPRVAAA